MQPFPPTIIIRHRKENLKKCSLRGLESRLDLLFISYPYSSLPKLENYLLLAVDAPPLTQESCDRGILILDATWCYAEKMLKNLPSIPNLIYRSLPSNFRTAYPRCQTQCPDPDRGLASVEALYLSYLLLGRPTTALLDHYYWKNKFLEINNL